MTHATNLLELYVFILAGFVGFFTITRVPALLAHLAPEGALAVDPADEITGPMLVVHGGRVRTGS